MMSLSLAVSTKLVPYHSNLGFVTSLQVAGLLSGTFQTELSTVFVLEKENAHKTLQVLNSPNLKERREGERGRETRVGGKLKRVEEGARKREREREIKRERERARESKRETEGDRERVRETMSERERG